MGYQSSQNYRSGRPPMMEDPDNPPPQGAFPVWSRVFTQPSVQTFMKITEHPEANAKGAYAWIFIAASLSALIGSLTSSIILRQLTPLLEQMIPNYGQMQQLPGGGFGVLGATFGLVGTVCSAALSGLSSMTGFAIGVTLVHAIASAFGGRGTFDKLAYAFGAISVPSIFLSALLTLLSAIPFGVLCTIPLILALGLYTLILQVMAIRAVHRLKWGASIAALFMPGVLLSLLCVVLLVVLRMILPALVPQMPQGIPSY